MNSKKLVSLLSAGALVLSSFSGLAMNGGVARAAAATTLDGDQLVLTGDLGDVVDDGTALIMLPGEKLTFTATSHAATAVAYGVGKAANDNTMATNAPSVTVAATAGGAADIASLKTVAAGTGVETDTFTVTANTNGIAADYFVMAIDGAVAAKPNTGDRYPLIVGGPTTAADSTVTLFDDAKMKAANALNGAKVTAVADGTTEVTIYSKALSDSANNLYWKNATAAKNILSADKFTLSKASDTVDVSGVTVALTAGDGELKDGTRDEYDGTYTLSITTDGLKDGDKFTVTVAATAGATGFKAAITDVIEVTVGAGGGAEDVDDPTTGKLPYAVFEAVDAAGTHYEDGKNVLTVQVPRAKLATETENEYLTYIRETAKKTVTINALWSASVDERQESYDATTVTATADKKVKNNDTGADESKTIVKAGQLTVNDTDYSAWTDAGINGAGNSFALTLSASASETTTNYTGKMIVFASSDIAKADTNGDGKIDANDDLTAYAGLMTIDVKVVVADSITTAYVANASSNAYDYESGDYVDYAMTPVEWDGYDYGTLDLDNGETGIAALKWVVKNPRGTVTEDSLTYAWGFVKDNGLDGADSKWLTDTEANKVFELTGADTEKVKIQPNTSILGGTYILRAQAKLGATVIKETFIKVSLTAKAGDTLTVTVNTSKLEKGYIEVPAKTTKVEEVTATATRASGADVTKTVTYSLLPYATYVSAVNNNSIATYAQNYGSTDITMSKGELTVKHAVEPGAYVVVAIDTKLGNYGVDDQNLIQVKSANGVAVTGLSLDQPEITITNLNSWKDVVATVLPVEYQANNYTKVSSKSAEVDALQLTVADPSVVDVWLNGRASYQDSSNKAIDNTWVIRSKAKKIGKTTVTVTTLDGSFSQKIAVSVLGEEPSPEPTPEPEHKAGDAFTVDGVSVFVNADGKTLTVTDVTVVGKTATIPATVDGMDVTAIAAQAFKKSDAKTIYVKAAVTDIEKGAFKKAKTKKIFFYEPAALNTVAKNAFKGANVKVVGVGGSFSESAASQLKKAGASKVKNNGTAK